MGSVIIGGVIDRDVILEMVPQNIRRLKTQRQRETWQLFEIEVTISTMLLDIPLYASGNRFYLGGGQPID